MYARQLASDPKTRDKAIALLQKEVVDVGGGSALRPRESKRLFELHTYDQLADILLLEIPVSPPAKRKELLKQVDDAFQKISDRDRIGYDTAIYRGYIAMVSKPGSEGAIEAIPELERARDVHKLLYQRGNEPHEWKLESLLAEAYMRGNQTGLAKQQLLNVIRLWPDQSGLGARKALAQMLVKEHDGEGAAVQAKEIARLLGPAAKDDKELQQLQAALIVVNNGTLRPQDVSKTVAAMPETTPDEVR